MPDIAQNVCERLDRIDITGALDVIWQEVRALNAYVAAEEPWKIAKDPDRAADLDGVLYRLAEGLRVVSILLHPWIPDATDKLLAALGEERRDIAAAQFGDWGGGHVRKIDPLFPRVDG
jgi:methionyl-tRNA synthetase